VLSAQLLAIFLAQMLVASDQPKISNAALIACNKALFVGWLVGWLVCLLMTLMLLFIQFGSNLRPSVHAKDACSPAALEK